MKFFIVFIFVMSSNAFASECDPFAKHGFFSAKKCEDGGYDLDINTSRDELRQSQQSLIKEQERLESLEKRMSFLIQLDAQVSAWSEEMHIIDNSLDTHSAQQIADNLKKLKDELIAQNNHDLNFINEELRKKPNDPNLNKLKVIIERVLNTVIDIVIPSSPLDLIPLKKPWSTIRSAINIYIAIKENWFSY